MGAPLAPIRMRSGGELMFQRFSVSVHRVRRGAMEDYRERDPMAEQTRGSDIHVHPDGGQPLLWDPLDAWPAARPWLWATLAVLACCIQAPSCIELFKPAREIRDFFQDWASARNVYHGLAVYTHQEATLEKYFNINKSHIYNVHIQYNAHPPS